MKFYLPAVWSTIARTTGVPTDLIPRQSLGYNHSPSSSGRSRRKSSQFVTRAQKVQSQQSRMSREPVSQQNTNRLPSCTVCTRANKEFSLKLQRNRQPRPLRWPELLPSLETGRGSDYDLGLGLGRTCRTTAVQKLKLQIKTSQQKEKREATRGQNIHIIEANQIRRI